ncbi:MAG: HD domain-containing protein [Gammaproteobacteria bacterium]|nr:HD domain-containing protein [Gammaproteobacteria bacterium]
MSAYPETVVDKILQVTLRSNKFAYLAIDADGKLVSQGGEIAAMGLPSWKLGESVLEQALFLSGYLPMTRDYEFIEAFEAADDSIVDIHLFRDQQQIWVILVDKTGDMEWESSARQSANELRLLKQQVLQRAADDDSDPHTQFDFFESLNMMALRANDDGSFECLEPVSDRFKRLYPESAPSSHALHPQERFPFVENFLVDAAEVWADATGDRRIRSGPWVERDGDSEVALEAIALNWKGNKLLFLEVLDESYRLNQSFLQIGREGVLLNRVLEDEVRKQTREIRAREEEIALRLVCAADSRDDGETGSHIRRLGLYSELIAQHLGWNDADAEEIRIAAPMHDIGKIGIPDHILKKPGQLTDSEFDIMKLHPEIGARILSNSETPLVQMARDICLGHHEKWDGSGYPRGLAGEQIPISARIVAIVDVFDALIHKRVYKREMPVEKAIDLMLEGRGSHFDPQLLDLFVRLKEKMTEIAFDYSNPIGDDLSRAASIIDDIHLLRPGD